MHEARRTRFEFVVEAGPDGLQGRRLRLGWFDEDASARRALQAGSRWSMPVLLRAPRGLPRLQAIWTGWLDWVREDFPDGFVF